YRLLGSLESTPSFSRPPQSDRRAEPMGLDRTLCVIGSLSAGRDRDLHVVQALQRTHDWPCAPGRESGGFCGAADLDADVIWVCRTGGHIVSQVTVGKWPCPGSGRAVGNPEVDRTDSGAR